MLDTYSPYEIKQYVLEQIKFATINYVSLDFFNQFADNFKFQSCRNPTTQGIVYRFMMNVLSYKLEKIEIKYPLNWYEAFKERWFPKWYHKKYPIKYKQIVIIPEVLYPQIPKFMDSNNIIIQQKESVIKC